MTCSMWFLNYSVLVGDLLDLKVAFPPHQGPGVAASLDARRVQLDRCAQTGVLDLVGGCRLARPDPVAPEDPHRASVRNGPDLHEDVRAHVVRRREPDTPPGV